VSEVSVRIHVTALFEDSAGQPIVGESATVDIYKVTCSGETRRAVGTPMNGKTDNQGRYVTPMIIGYSLHDAEDAVFIDASSACGSVHRRLSPGDLRPHAVDPVWEAEIDVCTGSAPPLEIKSPKDGDRLVVGKTVQFSGTTGCRDATLTFVADGKTTFGTLNNVTGAFTLDHAFNTAGADRSVTISVKDSQGCSGSHTLLLTFQPAFGYSSETLTQPLSATTSCSYHLHRVDVPLADPDLDVAGMGASAPKTVAALAAAHAQPRAAINAGYFDTAKNTPLSYARGHLGYESPVGNTKGPRSCLVIDRTTREARIELSMGRQPDSSSSSGWSASLYPATKDVVCGGPRLLDSGSNVAKAHVISEDFTSSGIQPDSAVPRTAACIREDGALTLFVAQPATATACGPDLATLGGLLRGRGCVDALNLDGGGSSALWFKGSPTVYAPGNEDRPVYQGLLVYAP
jgi:hypothetical protein